MVLIITGAIFSVAVKMFDRLSNTASYRAIQSGIRTPNTRDTLVWTKIRLFDVGWLNDAEVYLVSDTVGTRLLISRAVESTHLKRIASVSSLAGSWK